MQRQLICINCPRGCHLVVDDDLKVTGNACPRGEKYALEEISHPVRYVATTVAMVDSKERRLSVTTDKPIAKDLIFPLMNLLKTIKVHPPVQVGDELVHQVLGTDCNIVATKTILE